MKDIKMEKYSRVKKSGIDWLGNIPKNWELIKLKYIASIYNGDSLNESKKTKFSFYHKDHLPYISSKNIDLETSTIQYSSGLSIPLTEEKYKIAKINCSLICIEGGSAGRKIAFTKENVCFVNKLACISTNRSTNPKFIYYTLKGNLFQTQFKLSLSGMIGGVAISAINNFYIVFPSLDEQTVIARFLDNKTMLIDKAISIKQKQIRRLKERRQVLIHRVVTRGLNAKVKMKHSGVEWIGEVPEHWEIKRLKYLFFEFNNKTETGEEELFSLRMNIGLIPHNKVSNVEITEQQLTGYKIVDRGHMVMNRMRAAVGLFAIANSKGLVSPDYATFEISSKIYPQFYLEVFKTPLMCTIFRLNSKGMGTGESGFLRLYSQNFGNIKIFCPPIQEQKEIMQHLKSIDMKIKKAISFKEKEIEKLKEYKSTLINSAVTGKIKVC